MIPATACEARFHFGENGHHGFGSLGRRHQFEDGLAGKCQRAFRGDEQFGEVVAVLAPPAASPGLHDFAGFGQDFKAMTYFFVVPYFRPRSPPEFSAMLPPMVETDMDPGSGG